MRKSIILAAMMLLAGLAGAQTVPPMPTVLGENGAYFPPVVGASNYPGLIDVMAYGNQMRVRQDGAIYKIKLYCGPKAHLTFLQVRAWREISSNSFQWVGESENLASKSGNNALTTITLSSPFLVQAGDYISIRSIGSDNYLYATGAPDNVITYFNMSTAVTSTSLVAWKSLLQTNTVVNFTIYSAPPDIETIGDSIISGALASYAFTESGGASAITTEIGYKLAKLCSATATVQNMGVRGNDTHSVWDRWNADVLAIHPKYLVLEGGVNDINSNATSSSFIMYWTNFLNSCQAHNITPIVLKVLPWTNGTNSQNQKRDRWNALLATLAASYPTAKVVDASTAVGVFRAGGDAGNLWDIKPAYTADGVHFTEAGYAAIAGVLSNTLIPLMTPTPTGGKSFSGRFTIILD